MTFDPGSLAASLLFGLIGVAGWRHARQRQSMGKLVISAALVIYPWVVGGPLLLWGIGALLTLLLFVVP